MLTLRLVLVSLCFPSSACNQPEVQDAGAVQAVNNRTKGAAEQTPAAVKDSAIAVSVPLLLEAAMGGRTKEVHDALAGGLSPDEVDGNGRVPLMLAAFNGHTEVVRVLLEAGAVVGTRDSTGRTALMYASTGPHVETAMLLIARGAKVNDLDTEEGWTPLMFAAAEGQGGVVQLLLDKRADPTLKDADGDTAAGFALERGHRALAQKLQAAERSH
jgi:ankyrin repeat protein